MFEIEMGDYQSKGPVVFVSVGSAPFAKLKDEIWVPKNTLAY
jgi:hypothetical protein